jgi:hypothetical protein
MDWLGSGQPCLAIVDPDGAMARVVEQSGGGVVCATNRAGDIENAIQDLLDAHRSGTLGRLRPDPVIADRFEQSTTTDRLIDALVETTAAGRAS